MKTLRIALFFILGAIFTLHSFAQEVKKEKKAKFKMEVIDEEGNKKIIDTSFTISSDQDYAEIIRQIKKEAGYSSDEIIKMQQELEMHTKELAFEHQESMAHFDKDSMHKHMMIIRDKMFDKKGDLKKNLQELKVELEGLKMNEKAMEKLEKVMKNLQEVDWKDHTRLMDVQMDKSHKNTDKNFKVFVTESDDSDKQIWVDDNCHKRIIIKTYVEIEGDSLKFMDEDNVIILGADGAKNSWFEKDGNKIIVRKMKKDGNEIFFGDEDDLKNIEEIKGDQKLIVKKLRDEAAKGEAVFISGDTHVVKDFIDEEGNVKVMRYKMKNSDSDSGEMEIIVSMDDENNPSEKVFMISSANDKEMAKATEKGILKVGAESLELNTIRLEVEDEQISIGTTFEQKGKVDVKVLDKNMNQVWEKNAGKVSGDWSIEIPAEVLKESGKYFIFFNQDKKSKMFSLIKK